MTTSNEAEYGDRRVKGESMDDRQWAEWQLSEEEQRQFMLLKALQKVDRAGLHNEALLLAFEGGVLTVFKKELEHARQG